MINYVSNLPHDLRSGGFSSMNVATLEALTTEIDLHYAGPISPPADFAQALRSKLLRGAGFRGDFYFFSEKRLKVIAREVQLRCRPEATLDVFHGFTPWILTTPNRQYVASSDCTFHEYMNIFHRRWRFRDADLERIEQAEAAWLKNATRVIFRSKWAAEQAIGGYGLDRSRVRSVRSCGEIEMPERDSYAGGRNFVFVSTNFEAKGGALALAALRQVRMRHPGVSLTVVGHQPSRVAPEPGVEWVGYLRKEIPAQVERFQNILAGARALVHPTRGDVSPLILIEAGYFGCPAISTRSFAIPDIVDHGRTGVLLDKTTGADAVADAMCWMLENDDEYRTMRGAVWAKTREEYSKQQFQAGILSNVVALE